MRSSTFVRFATASATAGALAAVLGTAWADNGHRMIVANDLKWSDVPSLPPGAKISVIEGPMNEAVPFTARLKLPANYRIPAHMHPAIERVTVLSGTFHMGMGGKLDPAKGMALGAGDMMIMPVNSPHFAWTTAETLLQLHGTGPWGVTYINPADDPRKKP